MSSMGHERWPMMDYDKKHDIWAIAVLIGVAVICAIVFMWAMGMWVSKP